MPRRRLETHALWCPWGLLPCTHEVAMPLGRFATLSMTPLGAALGLGLGLGLRFDCAQYLGIMPIFSLDIQSGL